MNLDTYKFDTVANGNQMWRNAGTNRISASGLSQIVVGVNLRQEIIKRWGEVDTNKYTYTFAFMLKRDKSSTEQIGHMIGCGTVNHLPNANDPKDRLGDGKNNRRIYDRENSGIFVAGAYYNRDSALFQAGAMQSRKYQGIFNSNYQLFRNTFFDNDFSYYYDFCNNGNGIGDSENSSMVNSLRFWPVKRWGRIFSDIGNVSSISLANEGTEYFDLTPDVQTSKTTYFWMRIGVPPEGLQSGADCTLGRPPLRSRSTGNQTCHTNSGSPVIFFGKSSTPYFNVLDKFNLPNAKGIYPSVNVIGNTNDLQAAVVVPAAFARPQFATDGSDRNSVTNPYYEEEFGFSAVSTVILRTRQFKSNDWPANVPDDNFRKQFQWFADADVNFRRTEGEGYRTPYGSRIPNNPELTYNQGWGWNFYVISKYSDYTSFTSRRAAVTSLDGSPLWNNTTRSVAFFPVSPDARVILDAERGVGNYLALSTQASIRPNSMNY